MNPEEIRAALREPGTKVMAAEITPEMKARLLPICDEMIDELKKRTSGPFEAFVVLHFITETLKEAYGIRGAFTRSEDEHGST